jgi:hypothetical protein
VDNRYLTAFLTPKKHRVAGVWLDAFCCRHMLVLEAIKSPLLGGGTQSPHLDDLVCAIRICSTKSWQEAIDEPSIRENIKFNYLHISVDALQKAFEEFQIYISESMSIPKVWVKQDGDINQTSKTTGGGIPPSLSLVVLLMTKFKFSEDEAWNMPYCRAIWYSIAFSAQEGTDIKIITTEEEECAEEDKKRLDEIERLAREAGGLK